MLNCNIYDKLLNNMNDKLIKLINQQYDGLSKKIDSYKAEIDKFKDKVYDRMDSVYKEVLNLRLEQSRTQAVMIELMMI